MTVSFSIPHENAEFWTCMYWIRYLCFFIRFVCFFRDIIKIWGVNYFATVSI